MNETDFLSLLNDKNSIKNEKTNEITIIIPRFEINGEYHISSSCLITSNCNTIISSKIFRIVSSNVSLSNITFETTVLIDKIESLSLTKCTVKKPNQESQGALIIMYSNNIFLDNIIFEDLYKMPGLFVTCNSFVNAKNLNIHNSEAPLIVCIQGSSLKVTNSILHHTQGIGIYTSDQSYIEIRNCQIINTEHCAIMSKCSHCVITDNIIENIEGILLNNSSFFNIERNKK